MIRKIIVTITLLVLVIGLGGYYRFTGINWDDNEHLHPDERFLTMVTTSLKPVSGLSEYFDTDRSTLNPHNVGNHPNYVYGTLPIILTKYIGMALDKNDYNEVHIVGRYISGFADLLTLLLVFFAGWCLFDYRIGILAALLSAGSVLQIQLSHYFTVDIFCNFFTFLSLFIAILISKLNIVVTGNWIKNRSVGRKASDAVDHAESMIKPVTEVDLLLSENYSRRSKDKLWKLKYLLNPVILLSILFGLTSGIAVASKISAAPIVIFLPIALLIYLCIQKKEGIPLKGSIITFSFATLVSALVCLITFRVFQPYAFAGPGLFDFALNEQWMKTIASQRHLSGIDADWPPAMQWARRNILFAGKNLVFWGLGIPLGLIAWCGFFWAGWRIIKGQWKSLLLLWLWVALYFSWQSSVTNPTMRYQLPIYPGLAIFASWALFRILDLVNEKTKNSGKSKHVIFLKAVVFFILILTAGGTILWAKAFTSIYTRPVTRVEASEWIYDTIPGPVNVIISDDKSDYQQILPFRKSNKITSLRKFNSHFNVHRKGEITKVFIPKVIMDGDIIPSEELLVELRIWKGMRPRNPTICRQALMHSDFQNGKFAELVFSLNIPLSVEEGDSLQLSISIENSEIAVLLRGAAITNETSWDDSLPLRRRGYDPYGGIYSGDLNFEMYWDENEEKCERFITNLKEADYVIISSSRQWASLPRMPERFPLVSCFYRELLGIPPEKSIEFGYNIAEPGMYRGKLGFELIEVFQSDPSVGILSFNDQPSEEAFTVYDHPKVLIFKKSDNFDVNEVTRILSNVNLDNAIHLIPGKASKHPENFLLEPDMMQKVVNSGNWTDISKEHSPLNKSLLIACLSWYCCISFLGFAVFPMVRWGFPFLEDRGFACTRLAGLLLWAFICLVISYAGIDITRNALTLYFFILLTSCAVLWIKNYRKILSDLQQIKKYIISVEVIFLSVFLISLLLRALNPQIWFTGCYSSNTAGFTHFLSGMKSAIFPLYDPLFSQGYIFKNYFSYMYVGNLAKWLGILPEISFNIVLSTIYALAACSAYAIGWNYLFSKKYSSHEVVKGHNSNRKLLMGLLVVVTLLMSGNAGLVKNLLNETMVDRDKSGIVSNFGESLGRVISEMKGEHAFHGMNEFFFTISQSFNSSLISDFPLVSFLMGNSGAHFLTLPVLLFSILWLVAASSILPMQIQKTNRKWASDIIPLIISGSFLLVVLRMSNEVDYFLFGILSSLMILRISWKYISRDNELFFMRMLLVCGVLFGYFVVVSVVSIPHTRWCSLSIGNLKLWNGPYMSISNLMYHIGPFLVLFIIWLIIETTNQFNKRSLFLKRRRSRKSEALRYLMVMAVALLFFVFFRKLPLAYFLFPLVIWVWFLMTSGGLQEHKRLPMLLIIVTSGIVMFAEISQFSKMGERFESLRFVYFQSYVIYCIIVSLIAGPLINSILNFRKFKKLVSGMVIILFSTAFIYASFALSDRIIQGLKGSHKLTLNGTNYMKETNTNSVARSKQVYLQNDYTLMQWLRSYCTGTPIILEAESKHNSTGFDFSTLFTGMPNFLGSSDLVKEYRNSKYHEHLIRNRSEKIARFYSTTDALEAKKILDSFDVSYFKVGRTEIKNFAHYGGLEKFTSDLTGNLWESCYSDSHTTIFKVLK